MTAPILSFRNVGVAYRKRLSLFAKKDWVLRDLNFDLYRGEVLGVIGRNGAGKSTLLKLFGNIIEPDQGSIQRHSGITSQLLTLNLGFNRKLTGEENALMALVTHGMTIKQAKMKIDDVIKFAELEHISSQPLKTYSAGQRARLGFSISIQAKPDILLLDEILGVGDKNFKQKSKALIKEKVNSHQTVILVSHSAKTIKNLCSKAIWIENGNIKASGCANQVTDLYLKAQQA
ncbi:Teichoic acids export ATP-binding protein TagH [Microbulbifer aggregans]|uniref:Teichoic acids export ATP-binding protein TagH n=1 Tax=Microbulbifer aggregans TaxID=1769779 RepID=A0A1C9W9C6_9GAMM|nr:ATP-binding cassette domain-containing protein [Microbulbifer aggregans]AOS97768.1 Teichoic acids export ATP-binding protein TagH [Microbulbifer aggregans]